MAEYIDKQKLLKNFCGYDLTMCKKYGNETPEQQSRSYDTLMMYEIAWEIEDAPVVDIVPIRCKDCRFYVEYDEGGHYCEMLDCNIPGENFYCRDAVEKECDLMDGGDVDNR